MDDHGKASDHQVLTDSPADYAGYDLSPRSPELQPDVLGPYVTHIFPIHAAQRQLPVDSLRVDVEGSIDPRGGKPGYEPIPVYPHDIAYTVDIVSPASGADVAGLLADVERNRPILNPLKQPQSVRVELRHTQQSAQAGLPI